MRILVTGGAGFIGSNFVRYWHKNHPDDKSVIVDKLTYAGNKNNIQDLLEKNKNYSFIQADICDKSKLEEIITKNNVDLIVHFAAESHVDRSIESADDFINTNIIGTYNLLEIVKNKPEIRLHHVSTDEVFGDLPMNKPSVKFNEDTAYNPRSPYSASKASSDHLVRAYIETYEIKATISNCSNNYGPYCHPEKLIPLTITRALNNQNIPVYGDGKQIRDWIHVEDHVMGIEKIIKNGKLAETYLLGGDGEKENIWVVKEIIKILGKPESLIVHVGDRKGHDKRYAIDYSKASKELGFEPAKSFGKRLEETIDWYVKNSNWWKPLKESADKLAEKYLEI